MTGPSHSVAAGRPRGVQVAPPLAERLADPGLRQALLRVVRRSVPERDVEDIVQETLVDALASARPPEDLRLVRSWACGIARHKVGDFHRKRGREDLTEPEPAAAPPLENAVDLARWVEKELPDNDNTGRTLEWMLREGEGEKLESIADHEAVPPSTVRQRVSRLRRFFRDRWREELALLAALGVVAFLLWSWASRRPPPPQKDAGLVAPRAAEPGPSRGAALREQALVLCPDAPARCLELLDEAKAEDPAGDADPRVDQARRDAAKKLAPREEVSPPAVPRPGAAKPTPKGAATCACAKRDPLCGCW